MEYRWFAFYQDVQRLVMIKEVNAEYQSLMHKIKMRAERGDADGATTPPVNTTGQADRETLSGYEQNTGMAL